MKLCKDCLHYEFRPCKSYSWLPPAPSFWVEHRCLRKISPVTGDTIYVDAELERKSGNCGPAGELWMAMERSSDPQ